MRRLRLLSAAPVLFAGLLLASCTEPKPAVVLGSLRILPPIDSFYVGQTTASVPFTVTLFDGNGVEIKDGRAITYTSTAPTVFTVDAKTGQIAGKAVGSGIFRATVSSKFIEATVKILAPVAVVQLNTNDFTLNSGQTRQLVPTLVAGDGSSISGRAVSYSSSNTTVASVSTAGLVTAIAEGTATITATCEGKTASVVVTVAREVVANVTLPPPVAQILRVGGQLQVTATPRNTLNQPLTGRVITWFSSNPTVATVNAQGVVTALAVGAATITAECETRTAALGVTVTEVPVKSVAVDPDAFTVGTGLTRQLTTTVIDSAGRQVTSLTNRQVVWQSSSSIVASVGTTGVVTGIGAGTARISVTIDGVKSNDAVVTVVPAVASVRISPINPQLLRVGTTVQATAQALDNQNQVIPGKTINWLTNNSTVATVSQTGLVTGVGVGATTITAEVDGRSAALSVTVTLVPVGSVTFSPSNDTLVVGDQKQYNPVVRDTAGTLITSLLPRTVQYVSSNSLVLTTSAQAAGVLVNAGASDGQGTVTAFVDNVQSTPLLGITVSSVATISISPSSPTVSVGNTTTLTATIKDGAGNVLKLNRPIVSWSSSAPGIASVSQVTGGLTMQITGGATGTAVITVRVGGATQTITVTVN